MKIGYHIIHKAFLPNAIDTLLFWGRSSVGRVLDWQSRGRGFEPHRLHQIKLTDPRKFDTEPFLCFLRSVFFDHAMDYVRLKIHICINIHKHGCINNLKRLARGKR